MCRGYYFRGNDVSENFILPQIGRFPWDKCRIAMMRSLMKMGILWRHTSLNRNGSNSKFDMQA